MAQTIAVWYKSSWNNALHTACGFTFSLHTLTSHHHWESIRYLLENQDSSVQSWPQPPLAFGPLHQTSDFVISSGYLLKMNSNFPFSLHYFWLLSFHKLRELAWMFKTKQNHIHIPKQRSKGERIPSQQKRRRKPSDLLLFCSFKSLMPSYKWGFVVI